MQVRKGRGGGKGGVQVREEREGRKNRRNGGKGGKEVYKGGTEDRYKEGKIRTLEPATLIWKPPGKKKAKKGDSEKKK